ncbi:MAG TPA: alpha/beta fold hydrolase [Steroidobacteraceae bacterium]
MKPVALFLPGLMCDRAAWADVTGRLSDAADCRVPDYEGADTIEGMARAVLRGAPARFALAGHSMGGRVALEIMRQAPQRVARLALLDTGYQPRLSGEAGAAESRRRARLVDLAFERGMRFMGREWVRGMVHPERLEDRRLIDAILDMIERRTPEHFAAEVRALLARPDASAVLASIACPTLIVCGQEDSWSPPARHHAMAGLIPASRLELLQRCGHMAPMEQSGPVAGLLRGWLLS